MTQVHAQSSDKGAQIKAPNLSPLTEKTLLEWIQGFESDKIYQEIMTVNDFSMLHPEVLYILYRIMLYTDGPALEFGAYVGGSTVAMGLAAKSCTAGVVTVEPGGEYLSHPHIPSDDIFRDLLRNIERHGVKKEVHPVQGYSHERKVASLIASELCPHESPKGWTDRFRRFFKGRTPDCNSYKLFSIDSDGKLQRDFGICHSLLADDAYLVIDDYISTAKDKNAFIVDWVDAAVEFGLLSSLGVYGWGTWIGRFHGDKWKSWCRKNAHRFPID